MDELVLPEPYNWVLWTTSWTAIGPILIFVNNGQYDLAIPPSIIFLTSVNYWRYPIRGWRRNMDISFIVLSVIFHTYKVYATDIQTLYFLNLLCCLLSYQLSNYYLNLGDLETSTFWHATLHFIAAGGCFLLVEDKVVFTDTELTSNNAVGI